MISSSQLKKQAKYVADKIHTSELSIKNYVTTDNLLQNKLGVVPAATLPAQDGNVTAYKSGDILVANIRPYLKKLWYATQDGGCSADVLAIRPSSKVNSKFLYYALFRDDFFTHVMNGSKGTKMPRGDKSQIMDFLIPNFEIDEQQKIASVLSALDNKTELNNRINAELESMAKTLYDYWFVQFDFPDTNGKPYKTSGGKMVYNPTLKREIPKGWEISTLARWIKSDKTGDWGKESPEGNYTLQVDCIRGADINGINGNGKINTPNRFILQKNEHKLLEPFDLVIEISGGSPTQSTGRMAFITDDVLERFSHPIICSNFCKAISLHDNDLLYCFTYLWDSLYSNGVLFGWEGKTSGIKNLLFDAFVNKYHVPLPPKHLAKQFFEFAAPLERKKQTLLKENAKLESLRDWLLPMLMNGQVTVK